MRVADSAAVFAGRCGAALDDWLISSSALPFRFGPSLSNEKTRLSRGEVKQVADLPLGQAQPVDTVGELPREIPLWIIANHGLST